MFLRKTKSRKAMKSGNWKRELEFVLRLSSNENDVILGERMSLFNER
jgi:hypothetical protein